MIELTIVMLVMGIMAAAAAPRYFDSISRFRVKAATKRIIADLALARSQAKNTGSNQIIFFNPVNDSYLLPSVPDIHHPANVYHVELPKTAYPADLVSTTFLPNDKVTFDHYGRPDQGGSIVVASGNYQLTIILDAATGQASIP